MYKIGELAEISNLSKRTIDYYTKMGLLQCERSSSNYRFYEKTALDDLEFIEECKKINMPLEEIGQRLAVRKTEKVKPAMIAEQAGYIKAVMIHLDKELEEMCANIEMVGEKDCAEMINNLAPQARELYEKLSFLTGSDHDTQYQLKKTSN